MTEQRVTYNPHIFNVRSMAQARQIILTPESGVPSEVRWETETPYLLDLISGKCELTSNSWVLDYGCGSGRLAKGLIDRFGCWVVGIDISPSMRAMAAAYVPSPRFVAMSAEMLPHMAVKFDLGLAVWVLQHCLDPADDVSLIRSSLGDGSKLFLLNNFGRAVPALEHPWVNDGIDIRKVLSDGGFDCLEEGKPQLEMKDAQKWCFWALYSR